MIFIPESLFSCYVTLFEGDLRASLSCAVSWLVWWHPQLFVNKTNGHSCLRPRSRECPSTVPLALKTLHTSPTWRDPVKIRQRARSMCLVLLRGTIWPGVMRPLGGSCRIMMGAILGSGCTLTWPSAGEDATAQVDIMVWKIFHVAFLCGSEIMCGPPACMRYELWPIAGHSWLQFLETWVSDHRDQHRQVRQHGFEVFFGYIHRCILFSPHLHSADLLWAVTSAEINVTERVIM